MLQINRFLNFWIAYINDKEATVDTVISNIKSAVLATNQ
nr:MAG TPA: Protein of unknown function (DUF1249) [Caudoviricetes sp.]